MGWYYTPYTWHGTFQSSLFTLLEWHQIILFWMCQNIFSVFSGEGAAGPYPAPAAAGAQGPGVPRVEGDQGGDEGAQEPQVSCHWSPLNTALLLVQTGHNTLLSLVDAWILTSDWFRLGLAADERCCAEQAKVQNQQSLFLETRVKWNRFQKERRSKFLVMGKRPERPGKDMKLTFMVPWSKSKVKQNISS